MRRLLIIAIATVLWLLAAAPALAGGGGGGAGDDGCAGFSEGDDIGLRDSCIDGAAHFLPEGEDLLVVNEGRLRHNYVAVDGSFGTGRLEPGEETVIEAPDPGVYRVWCQLHASEDGDGMAGVLIVGDPDEPAALGAATDASASAPGGGQAASAAPTPAHWPTLATASAGLLVAAAALLIAGRALARTGQASAAMAYPDRP